MPRQTVIFSARQCYSGRGESTSVLRTPLLFPLGSVVVNRGNAMVRHYHDEAACGILISDDIRQAQCADSRTNRKAAASERASGGVVFDDSVDRPEREGFDWAGIYA